MAKSPLNQPLLTPEELPARLVELYDAIDQFNAGWYFESHETLEDLWMVTPLPARTLMQGVIQLAAAFVHFARGEYPGIFKLIDASSEKLAQFAPAALGIDIDGLLASMARARGELEALGSAAFRSWDDRGSLPRIVYRR